MNELLKRICETPGVSGFETEIRELVSAELTPSVDEIYTDRMGNLIARKKAAGNAAGRPPLRVMLSAHMDEIGFMVKHVDDAGFVRFLPIGGFDPRTVVGQRVIIHGRKPVLGVIAPQPNWILSEAEKKSVLGLEDMFIDVGLTGEAAARLIAIGDPITLQEDFQELNDEVYTARNFDNRLSVYIMIETMRRLRTSKVDVYAVATVQEEVGVRGATVAAYAIDPDVGIALDESLASDVPYARAQDRHCELGRGAGIYIMDSRTISDPRLITMLTELAESSLIPYQRNIGGGTDASVIQRTKAGSIACTIGPPARYMHSTTQLCHRDDLESCIRLLTVFLEHAHEATWAYPQSRRES